MLRSPERKKRVSGDGCEGGGDVEGHKEIEKQLSSKFIFKCILIYFLIIIYYRDCEL